MHIVPSTKILNKAELLAFSHIACQKIMNIDSLVHHVKQVELERTSVYYGPGLRYIVALSGKLFNEKIPLLNMDMTNTKPPDFISKFGSFMKVRIDCVYFSSPELIKPWMQQKDIDKEYYPECSYFFDKNKSNIIKIIDIPEHIITDHLPIIEDSLVYLSAITDGDQRYILRFLEIIESELTAASHSA